MNLQQAQGLMNLGHVEKLAGTGIIEFKPTNKREDNTIDFIAPGTGFYLGDGDKSKAESMTLKDLGGWDINIHKGSIDLQLKEKDGSNGSHYNM